jgi:hypothetical protein
MPELQKHGWICCVAFGVSSSTASRHFRGSSAFHLCRPQACETRGVSLEECFEEQQKT